MAVVEAHKKWAALVLFTVVYFLTGTLGLQLNAVGGYASLIWPPSGISLAVLLLFGTSFWPGIAVGAFLVNWSAGAPWAAAGCIAIGNTLETVLAIQLLSKIGFERSFPRLRDVLYFLLVGSAAGPILSAGFGVTALGVSGIFSTADYLRVWCAWWTGDFLSNLVLTPLILIYGANPFKGMSVGKKVEFALYAGMLISVSVILFAATSSWSFQQRSLSFVLFPLVMWGAISLRHVGAVTAAFVITAWADYGVFQGIGFFGIETFSVSETLYVLHVFITVIASTGLILAAIMNQRIVAEEAATAANRNKDDFLAVLSHELRSPLNVISGWVQMLKGEKLTEELTEEGLSALEKSTKVLVKLIGDVLDVSSIMAGKLKIEARPLDMASLVRGVVESYRLEAKSKGVVLRLKIDAVSEVIGDSVRLQQVIANLLSNAIKFSSEGGRVEVSVQLLPTAVEVRVKDEGRGIDPSFLPNIFEAFQQESGTKTESSRGLGLGLSIVKQIVGLHGGEVRALSEGRNHGACFVVSLPRSDWKVQRAASTSSFSPFPELPQSQSVIAESYPLKGIHVLVVDDSPDLLAITRVWLERAGAIVSQAASAREAFSVVLRTKPDVLISDIGMPEEDGYSLLKRIRGLPEEKGGRIPAAALSAYVRAEEGQRSLQAGFQMHLSKPIHSEALVMAALKLHKTRSLISAGSTPPSDFQRHPSHLSGVQQAKSSPSVYHSPV